MNTFSQMAGAILARGSRMISTQLWKQPTAKAPSARFSPYPATSPRRLRRSSSFAHTSISDIDAAQPTFRFDAPPVAAAPSPLFTDTDSEPADASSPLSCISETESEVEVAAYLLNAEASPSPEPTPVEDPSEAAPTEDIPAETPSTPRATLAVRPLTRAGSCSLLIHDVQKFLNDVNALGPDGLNQYMARDAKRRFHEQERTNAMHSESTVASYELTDEDHAIIDMAVRQQVALNDTNGGHVERYFVGEFCAEEDEVRKALLGEDSAYRF